MSDKKGKASKKLDVPKVEIDPADDVVEVEEERVAAEQKVEKASVVSVDSGAYSQDDPSASKVVEKDVKGAGSSETPKVDLGEGSHQLTPESSASKSKRSKFPIKIIKDKAQSIAKGLKTILTMSPSKKSGLTDPIEVEHERTKPKSPTKETKAPKTKKKSLKLSELYEKYDTDSETCESAVTTTSNVPASDDTSVDEKSDNLDDYETKDDIDDSVEDSKK